MCRATTCKICQKTTWTGCGQHIDAVKRSVSACQWCNGRHTEAEIAAAASNRGGGVFARLFGR